LVLRARSHNTVNGKYSGLITILAADAKPTDNSRAMRIRNMQAKLSGSHFMTPCCSPSYKFKPTLSKAIS
jgi:hypothetical protein